MLTTVATWLALFNLPVPAAYFQVFAAMLTFLILALGVVVIHLVLKRLLIPVVFRLIKQTEFTWDDSLMDSGLVLRLFQFIPLVLIYEMVPAVFVGFKWVASFLTFIELWLLVQVALVANSVLNAVLLFSKSKEIYKSLALKSYIQLLRLGVFFVAAIVGVSMLIGKSPLVLLSGLGALSAVLLLVFRDSILGFTASLQLAFNNLVETGDWIEVPEYGADGTVIDVSLTTIKVQNWDKTITSIPTYSLVAGSFKNWKGMEKSGGRRIKRAVNIDMTSVRFLNETVLGRLQQIELLKPWLDKRQSEIDSYNSDKGLTGEQNGRHLTNLGAFRAYLELYLQHKPEISDQMTFLVRHLQPTPHGLPVEFYVFSNKQNWAEYESIQADIMDHVLAILPQFGLRVFQEPTGYDMKFLAYTASQNK